MSTKRERVTAKIAELLEGVGGAKVKRNDPIPQAAPAEGLVIIHDGDPGDPEVTLGAPVVYEYDHEIPLDVVVQKPTTAARVGQLDTILQAIGAKLAEDRTLGGLVTWVEWGAPETQDERFQGNASLKGAVVPLVVTYETTDPLGG